MEDFAKVIRERRSIRRYLPERVSETILREILDEARWAPSWGNTQSSLIYVLSAAALERFKASLLKKAVDEVPSEPDIEMPSVWPEPFGTRMTNHLQAEKAFVAAEEKKRGIVSPDPPVSWPVASAGLFGAPHLLLVATGKDVCRTYGCYDAGLLTENIVLAAQARGLGTCIVASAVRHPDLLRAIIPDTQDKVFIVGITLGYADHDAVVNQFPRQRAPLAERVRFVTE